MTFTAGQLVHRADRWWCHCRARRTRIASDDSASVTHTVDDANSDDAYDGLSIDSVAVSVADDDVTATVSVSELEVAEGGVGDLHGEAGRGPGESDVVIDLEVTGDSDVTVSEASLTFTPGNWSTAQTVVVSAAHDDDIASDDSASVTHTVDDANSDDAYDGLSIDSVAVSVADDDVTATVSVTELEVAEGGSGTYTVKLDVAPATADVVIDLEVTGDSDVTVSEASLTFTAGQLVHRADGGGVRRARRRHRLGLGVGGPHRRRRQQRRRLRRAVDRLGGGERRRRRRDRDGVGDGAGGRRGRRRGPTR